MANIDVGVVIGGKYTLTRMLGAGGMGQVWLAHHMGLRQDFALKLLAPPEGEAENDATAHRRFENEAQIAAALSRASRHIVSVVDFGTDQGLHYLVMELLEGTTLEDLLSRGPLEGSEVARVISQVSKALEVAHARGVVHRDIKPGNVFLARSPEEGMVVKLFDFGIARLSRRIVPARSAVASPDPTKLTMKGLVLGTPAYMSPEQAMGQPTDARADVWALAVMAFEALAGDVPFSGPTIETTLVRICNCQPKRLRELVPAASSELDVLFAKAFARDIGARFQNASEFSTELARCLPASGAGPIRVFASPPATTMVAVEAPAPSGARSRAWMIGASAIAVVVVAAASVRHVVAAAPVLAAASAALPSAVPSAAAPAPVTSASSVTSTHAPSPAAPPRHERATTYAPRPRSAPPASSKDRSSVF